MLSYVYMKTKPITIRGSMKKEYLYNISKAIEQAREHFSTQEILQFIDDLKLSESVDTLENWEADFEEREDEEQTWEEWGGDSLIKVIQDENKKLDRKGVEI